VGWLLPLLSQPGPLSFLFFVAMLEVVQVIDAHLWANCRCMHSVSQSLNIIFKKVSLIRAVKKTVLHWLNKVNGVYLVQVSLFLIGQQGLADFFRYRPLLPIS
jgi:hypothetical protein